MGATKRIVSAADRVDVGFEKTVLDQVGKAGFLVVQYSEGIFGARYFAQEVAIIISRAAGRNADSFMQRRLRRLPDMPFAERVLITLREQSETYRDRIETTYECDVIALPEVRKYFMRVRSQIDSAMARSRSGSQIDTNASSIAALVKSLGLQIDAKLERLRGERPNHPEAITHRDAEISEFEQLRARVDALEKAVAQLRLKKPKTKPAVKEGGLLRKALAKYAEKHAGKNISDAATMGILFGATGLLMLLGVDPGHAVTSATTVLTGKAASEAIRRRR